MSNYSSKTKGILFLIIAAFGFALMSMFVKFVDADIPIAQKVFFRNGVSMIVSLIMVISNKSSFYGKKENQKILLSRSAFGTMGMLLFFYSITKLDLSDANMLNKLSTFFLILFSAVFLKEKVEVNRGIAIIIAFIGSLFIIKPALNIDILPYMTSIMAAAFAGAAYTLLRVLGKKEKYYTVVLYFSTFSVIVLLPFVIINFEPMSNIDFVYLILVGVFATVGQFGTTLAYKYAPANEISIFNYTNVIFAAIISITIFDVSPDPISLIGYVIIFSAAYYVFRTKK